MRALGIVAVLISLAACPSLARAHVVPRPFKLDRVNRQLQGQVVDYTANHGSDNRIWSPSLEQKRDMYVYLPPNYCPAKHYPLILFLHGFRQDEMSFLQSVVMPLDRAIVTGQLPPVIVAAPDASLRGTTCLFNAGTFFINTPRAGQFGDYLVEDVYQFMCDHYSIRPEREAHVLLGVSMGGGAAYVHAIQHPEKFGVAVGIFPPLNLRWISCRGRYMDNFDPDCWGWRTDFNRSHEVVARFAGVVTVRLRQVIVPLYGRRNPETLERVIETNPIEMLDIYDVKPGEFEFYIAYGGKDEFNIDAQVESFLYRAKQKGVEVTVDYDPEGRHNEKTALQFLPSLVRWLNQRLEPYAPQ
jgi:pimeloyl-ACP methyl ester carboxylesterase